MAGITTYESDSRNRIAPESIMENQMLGLEIVDGHAVKAPADYQDPDELYRMLIGRIRKYHPSTDVSMVEKAYRIAKNAHEGQYLPPHHGASLPQSSPCPSPDLQG